MRKVQRSEILDYVTYGEQREAIRSQVMGQKAPRRVHLGEHLTFLFENHDTVRYQILEMIRAERIVKEAEILHELQTYNEILGDEGELGCTLMIEIPEAADRPAKLAAWRTLPEHLYLVTDDQARVRPSFDARQIGEDRLSSVQFLKFGVGRRRVVAIGSDHPELTEEALLTSEQSSALAQDLAEL